MVQQRRGVAAASGLAAVLAVLAAGVTGCSDQSAGAEDRIPADPVYRAADVLARSGSSLARTTTRMTGGPVPVTISGSGAFDYRRRLGRLTVVAPGPVPAGTAAPGPITEVLTPGLLYMRNRGQGVPAGTWVRVDTTRLPDGNLVTGGATDPMTAAELLRGARSVSFVEERTLDGVPVRHYRGTADIARAARLSPRDRASLRAAADGLASRSVPFDAYLDQQGRLRQVREVFTFRTTQGLDRVVTATTELSGFGTPVRVALPGPGEVFQGKIVSPQD